MTAATLPARQIELGSAPDAQRAAPPPTFKPEYQELKFTLHRKLLDRINLEVLSGIDDDRIRAEVRHAVLAMVEEEPNLLTAAEKQHDQPRGAARGLRAWAARTAAARSRPFRDILVNGHQQVYVERKGLLELTNVRFHDDAHLLRIIDKIVSQVGRRVDESNPMVDARLQRRLARQRYHSAAGGGRAAALDPAFRHGQADAGRPGARGSLTRGMMRLLEAAVKAKLNMIVSGGTGAGKTTLLNALSCVHLGPRSAS